MLHVYLLTDWVNHINWHNTFLINFCVMVYLCCLINLLLTLLLTIFYMLQHFLFYKMRSTDDRQGPVLVLANRNQQVLFLEKIVFLSPPFNTFITICHWIFVSLIVRIYSEVLLLLHTLRHLLQLGEELWIKDVALLLLILWNNIVLQKAKVKEDKNIVKIDPRLKKFKIFFRHFHSPI